MPPSRSAFTLVALLACITSAAHAQPSGASDTPLHLAVSAFTFTASREAGPLMQPLRVHNGGSARFTDVRIIGLTYADSTRSATWLVALPRQTSVAPDELATVGTLCVDATGLPAGTYHATAAVRAREVPSPVPVRITLVVTPASARVSPGTAAPCRPATK